jgi:hypothetical protein
MHRRHDALGKELLMNSDRIFEKWEREVRAAGMLEGKAAGVFAVLGARGLVVTDRQAARIRVCEDGAVLDEWLVRAATAARTAELFARNRARKQRPKAAATSRAGRARSS